MSLNLIPLAQRLYLPQDTCELPLHRLDAWRVGVSLHAAYCPKPFVRIFHYASMAVGIIIKKEGANLIIKTVS
jgi:hypothetical protein